MRIIVTVYFTFYLLQGNKKEKKLYKIMIDILAKSLRLEIYIRYIFTSFYLMTFTKIVKVFSDNALIKIQVEDFFPTDLEY